MVLTDINNYVENKDCLTKIETVAERIEDGGDFFYVTKTKETWVFGSEEEADDKINEVRRDNGFAAAEKKYKAGKMNKSGDVVKAEQWVVVIKLNH